MTADDRIFSGLNEQQAAAVRALKGPVLILAGAGSGKTRALTHRIANLIAGGVPPWQILAVTFTNKAANEMKQRIVNLLRMTHDTNLESETWNLKSPTAKLPVMGTFHAVCVRMLRRDIEHIGRNRNFVIYDTDDQETLMKEVLKEMNIDTKEFKAVTALAHIGRFKCEAMSSKEVAEQATTEWMARIVKIYELYQSKLRSHNALDFDDLILETVRLFREVPTVLDRYQESWRYLNVDEYQDTNHAQYLLISLLSRKHRNLCVIGDPDQSIYGFRGADIRNILQFQKEYPDALSVKLERNYRSTQPILDCADAVIAANPRRPQKKMWTPRMDGEKICMHEVADEKHEAAEAVQYVLCALRQGIPLNEQVILYRTNAQSRLFEETCLRSALPYRIVGGVKFYARREVKDVLAYLRAIHNPEDALSLLRIINVPSRKIGTTTIEHMQRYCQEKNMSLWEALNEVRRASTLPVLSLPKGPRDAMLSSACAEPVEESKHVAGPAQHDVCSDTSALSDPTKARLAAFASLIERYQKRRTAVPVAELAIDLLKEVEMEKWVKDGTSEGEARWENVGELLTVMHKYDGLDPELSLMSFLEEVALISEVDQLSEVRSDALTLMTLHLCKGLEFQHVLIAGCEEGLLPHSSALFDRPKLEEERRLLYVGMTRAKDLLRLFCTRSRTIWGSPQANAGSRFLDDLPPEHTERKSDDILSPLLWKQSKSVMPSSPAPFAKSAGRIEAPSLDFNQDVFTDDINQEPKAGFTKGSRISHPVFGEGTVTGKRGDVVEISFDSGKKKRFALSIAPLQVL